jgi:EAL domain-containing protein (putative c-di-GMP-specific phosphodiesterase class I)/ActR/RegA family two-component response regulator
LTSNEKRVLTIDDDGAACRTIDLVARTAGFEARSTSDATEFFRLVEDWQPTHLVLDLVMPGLDGVDVLHRLAEMGTDAQVIVTSGHGQRVAEAARRVARELSLASPGILPKPFSASLLRRLLHEDEGVSPCANAGSGRFLAITAADINSGLERREFVAHYQPKIDCATERIVGFEALARWDHPEVGVVFPDSFIRQAEDGDLINALSEQVAESALAWFGRTFAPHGLELALNFSGRAVSDPGLADAMSSLCTRYGVCETQIVLEVTETYAMADPTAALALLTRFRIRGFQLAIDDFGIGYSSLAQLARLPFSELKVDRSFVASARTSEESRKIVAALISLSHSLGLRVAAEGVEDGETLAILRDLGCHHAQGYFIGRPMGPEETRIWVENKLAPGQAINGRP